MNALRPAVWALGLWLASACAASEPPPPMVTPASPAPVAQATRPEPATRVLPTEPSVAEAPSPPAERSSAEATAAAPAQGEEPAKPERTPDVVYVPTPEPVVAKMLELAKVKKSDLVYDLGCGDGRIVVTAAKKYGARAVGFDIDPARVKEARENVAKNGVEDLVTIEQKDIFQLDLSPASVVTLYLLPELNVRLIPQLQKLKPGARIVSHDFDMEGVTPLKHVKLKPPVVKELHQVFLWHAPIVKQ